MAKRLKAGASFFLALRAQVHEYLKREGALTLPLPGIGTLSFPAGSPRTAYSFTEDDEEDEEDEDDEDDDE